MKVRERERVRTLIASGVKIFDLYDLMDRAGTYTFRFTRKYINVPLTAAATGLLGNQVGGDAFDWNKLIYTPLFITAGICAVGLALKVPNFLSAAKRHFARLQGHINMVQLKRNRRAQHAKLLWDRHFVYHTREAFTEDEMAAAERSYLQTREQLIKELESGLSSKSIDHLELENLEGADREDALADLALAMEYETPTSPGIETCESAFHRTLMFSLRSDEAQRETQEKSGYSFSEYKTWLRQTFFDSSHPPLAGHLATDVRVRNLKRQLKHDGVDHDTDVRLNWYIFPGLAQRFWHANTIRKVNLLIGKTLSLLSRKYKTHLNVQSILWPGNHRHAAFQVTANDGAVLGDELHEAARAIIRRVYGEDRGRAALMLDRAMLNNFIETKGLRALVDYAYCSGDGLDQSYLEDLDALTCCGALYKYHERFVLRARAAMVDFEKWLADERPGLTKNKRAMSAIRDAYHRNWEGLRELVASNGGADCYNIRTSYSRFLGCLLGGRTRQLKQILDRLENEEVIRQLRAERDAIRIYDTIAHLEYDTYRDLIERLGEYDDSL